MLHDVAVACAGRIGSITLQRPHSLNALTERSMTELITSAKWLNTQPDCRVVTVRGAGRSFCAGFDLGANAATEEAPPGQAGLGELGHDMGTSLENLPVTVAALHGNVVGGGVVIAASCDLRIATRDARLIIPEVALGVPLAWGGIPRLMRELGPSLTKELVMTCRPWSADEALATGFLSRVVETPEELEEVVAQLADTLASRPRHALLATKRGVNAVSDRAISLDGAWADASMLAAALRDDEGREAREAYLARVASQRGAK